MNVMRRIESKSLRWKIVVSMSFVFFIMSISLIVTVRIDQYAMHIIGKSYESNSRLAEFQKDLEALENSLEMYIAYRTFESIDSYYTNSVSVENFCASMQEFPSTNEVSCREYAVNQLAQSFLHYSSKAVALRRANSSSNEFYAKSLECYTFLLDEISRLTVLYTQKNARVYDADRKKVNFIFHVYLAFFALLFIFVLLLLGFFAGTITKPLAEISNVALRIARRDFDVPLFNRTSSDEIGTICQAFDRMIISIREYSDTIWKKARIENELRERELEMRSLYADAQLKAFQSQINPHFLFNTLNTGAQLAMMEGADKTCFFIEQTSDFFRYNIQQKEDAAISEELALVDSFVYIMKVRFGKRLEFAKEVPDETFRQRLPAMTLQPLVENCIQHGLQNAMGKVFLKLERKNGCAEIAIGDNGPEFDDGIRERILRAVRSGSSADFSGAAPESEKKEVHAGIGLINVFSRLRLYFHRDDIFDICAGKNESGIKFIIRVPDHV